MENLKFFYTKLPMPLLDDLKNQRILKGTTRGLLGIMFEHGGYIAGGFGTILARHYLLHNRESDEDFEQHVRRHLGYPSKTEGKGKFVNAGCGDIDVWFPSQEAVTRFMNDARVPNACLQYGIEVNPTLTGAAVEYLVEGDARIQVVHRWVKPLEEQIHAFDIFNGAVAFTNTVCVTPEHWELLESGNMLHVSTWASPWTINRFFKWVNRKGYTAVTPATAEHVYGRVHKALDWKEKWGEETAIADERIKQAIYNDRLKRRFILQGGFRAQEFLRSLMPGLTGEQLLEVSALFPEPIKYDFAMQEIRRRIPPQ
jgi:hypothetical protein